MWSWHLDLIQTQIPGLYLRTSTSSPETSSSQREPSLPFKAKFEGCDSSCIVKILLMLNFFNRFSSFVSSVLLTWQNRKSHFFIGASNCQRIQPSWKSCWKLRHTWPVAEWLGSTPVSQTQARQASYPISYKQVLSCFPPQYNGYLLKFMNCWWALTGVLGQDTIGHLLAPGCCPVAEGFGHLAKSNIRGMTQLNGDCRSSCHPQTRSPALLLKGTTPTPGLLRSTAHQPAVTYLNSSLSLQLLQMWKITQ